MTVARWPARTGMVIGSGLVLLAALLVGAPPVRAPVVAFGAVTTFAVQTSPRMVAVGRFNADSVPDLAVPNASSATVSILLGNGTGGFGTATNVSVGTASSPRAVAVGDFNGD